MAVLNKEAKALILKAIGDQPGITRPELIAATGLTKEVVRREIDRLGHNKVKIKAEYYTSDKSHHWYLYESKTIVDRIEDCIKASDKALNYREVAAMCNIEQAQTANPLNILMKRGHIINGPSITLTNKDVATYIHSSTLPRLTISQAAANSLGVPHDDYDDLISKGYKTSDIEEPAFLYASIDELRKFMGGSRWTRL